jgi:hypothetical protein
MAMRRVSLYALIAGCLLAGWLTFAHAREGREPSAYAAPIWEYRLLYLPDIVSMQTAMKEPSKTATVLEAKYNELGRDGWEYCENSNGLAIFKRPKP